MGKVLVQFTRGGRQKRMAEPYARVLEKVGLATRVVVAKEPEKKKRGRPKKIITGSGALAAQSSTARTYQRRDLKADD